MMKKVFSNASVMGLVLVMTSAWVGQAHAFSYTKAGVVTGTLGKSCEDATYGSNTKYDASSGCNVSDTRSQESTAVTAPATLRTAAANISNLISSQVPMQRSGEHKTASNHLVGKGVSAGNYANGVNLWFNATFAHLHNDVSSTHHKGDLVNALVGLDYEVSDDVRAGVGVGYESSGYVTSANYGGVRGTGGMIVPYMAFDLDDMWRIDLQVGYAKLNYHLRRLDPGDTLLKILGETDGHRYFGAANMNAMHQCHAWHFNSRIGLLYASENIDAFTDTSGRAATQRKTKLGRLDTTFNAVYNVKRMVEPFVAVNPLWDFNQTNVSVYRAQLLDTTNSNVLGVAQEDAPNGRFAVIYSAGLRMDVMKKFDAVLTASTEQHRRHQKSNAVALTANAEF